MDDCIFCKIVKGELPSAKIYETDKHIAILDLYPVSEGHTLLIPKNHHVNIFDSDESDIAMSVYPALVKLAKAIKKATGCKGLNIIQNNEAIAGQIVFHSHIHLIPRYDGDNIKISVAGKTQASYDQLNAVAEKIKKNI